MEFNLEGIERQVPGGALVPLGGKLPLTQELRTSQLLDFIVAMTPDQDKNLRQRINRSLYTKTRPGFYMEIKPNLHLAYADQRDGHGSQHWWRLFFDDQWKDTIERVIKGTALAVGGQSNRTNGNGHNGPTEWGGMMFRSPVEIKIAEALDKRGVLFFANARGRISGQGSPVSASSGWLTGRIEIDFLVFHKGQCMSLEVDGKHHEEEIQTQRDYIRDRVLLRERIPTARFAASECLQQPDAVIEEFLNLFSG
jgi:hypothetical protein